MANPKADSPIADCENGNVQHLAHDDTVLVSFTDPAKKNKPRNHTLTDVPDLIEQYEALQAEREATNDQRAATLLAVQEKYDAAAADIAKRQAGVDKAAFAAARKELAKREKQAAKAAAAAADDTED